MAGRCQMTGHRVSHYPKPHKGDFHTGNSILRRQAVSIRNVILTPRSDLPSQGYQYVTRAERYGLDGRPADPDQEDQKGRWRGPPRRCLEGRLCRLRHSHDGLLPTDVAYQHNKSRAEARHR